MAARLAKLYARAKAQGKTPDEIFALRLSNYHEAIGPRDAIHQLQHDYLVREAERYFIPIPYSDREDDERWEESSITGKSRLCLEELAKLRTAIRIEHRERWESVSRWIPVITAITGLLGGIIGVLAFLERSPPAH